MQLATQSSQWPKALPPLSDEQKNIREDFYKLWLDVLPKRYGLVEKFNHHYPLRTIASGGKTLEIGAGIGVHLRYENLDTQEYVALELRSRFSPEEFCDTFPSVQVVIGDCQERIDFPDNYFDRVLAIHVFEHLPNLPKALDEIQRLLRPGGTFSVLIPCEGGFAYSLARNISARRHF